jgi:hypothetical protein
VSLDQLIAWAGISAAPYEVSRLLDRTWRAFVTAREERPRQGLRYRLYHASLRDFLTGDVDRTGLSVEEEYLVDELSNRTREAHARIIESYRQQCGGDWPKIVDQDYPRRHLATHLAGAGAFDELFDVVTEGSRWAEARYRVEGSHAGYLEDLRIVWSRVESDEDWNLGKQIRCALIEGSVRALAGSISPGLLKQLVETQTWSLARALAHIPLQPYAAWRSEALSELAEHLPEALKAEALAAARQIGDESARAYALSGLAEHLPEAMKANAIREASVLLAKYRRNYGRFNPLADLILEWHKGDFYGFEDRCVWSYALHRLAQGPRSELLHDLSALAPLTEYLGGFTALAEMLAAIRDVTRWWP